MSSEEKIQQDIRLDLASMLWRNNSGAMMDQRSNRLVRYGLANESAEANAQVKSSDLIGITPTLIRPEHVGYYFGVFTAIEVKRSGWHLTPGDKHGQAQRAFHDIVRSKCGFAGFAQSLEDYRRIICQS